MSWFGPSELSVLRAENVALKQRLADAESRIAAQTRIHASQVNTIARLRGALSDVFHVADVSLTQERPDAVV